MSVHPWSPDTYTEIYIIDIKTYYFFFSKWFPTYSSLVLAFSLSLPLSPWLTLSHTLPPSLSHTHILLQPFLISLSTLFDSLKLALMRSGVSEKSVYVRGTVKNYESKILVTLFCGLILHVACLTVCKIIHS